MLLIVILLPLQYRMAAEVMAACLVEVRVSQSCLETGVTQQLFVCAAGEKEQSSWASCGERSLVCACQTPEVGSTVGTLLNGGMLRAELQCSVCLHVLTTSAVTCLGCLETLM